MSASATIFSPRKHTSSKSSAPIVLSMWTVGAELFVSRKVRRSYRFMKVWM